MKTLICSLTLAAASLCAVSSASANVVDFDDLADGFVPTTYAGIDWSAGDWFAFGGPQDPYTPHSGDVRVTSGFGDPDAATTIRFTGPATFQGAWFAGLSGAFVQFQLYAAGQLVATSAVLDPTSTPQFLASGYDGWVDRVIVSSPAQGSFVMDDFTFTTVPEPAPALLLVAGLTAWAVRRGVRPSRRTTVRERSNA